MKKYYFIHSLYSAYGQPYQPQTCVTEDIHPFQWCYDINSTPINENYDTVLVTWKEITEEEYNLFNTLDL